MLKMIVFVHYCLDCICFLNSGDLSVFCIALNCANGCNLYSSIWILQLIKCLSQGSVSWQSCHRCHCGNCAFSFWIKQHTRWETLHLPPLFCLDCLHTSAHSVHIHTVQMQDWPKKKHPINAKVYEPAWSEPFMLKSKRKKNSPRWFQMLEVTQSMQTVLMECT